MTLAIAAWHIWQRAQPLGRLKSSGDLQWRMDFQGQLGDLHLQARSLSLQSPLCHLMCHEVQIILTAGAGGGGLDLVGIQGPIVEVKILGAAASVMTVRVAVSQKLREKFPTIAAVKLV